MLRASAVWKSFGAQPVLRGVSCTVSRGDRLGLVGPNGAGKSTLLRLLAGHLVPDQGSVWTDPGITVAYLPQYPGDELHLSVEETLWRGAGRVGELAQCLAGLEHRMATLQGDALDAALRGYADLQAEFERLDGYNLDARLSAVTAGLGMDVADRSLPVSTLSGGTKTKLLLARLLLSGADLLLLDEPTNYLDLPALLWLESFLLARARTYVVVSHDRRFLDRTVQGILEIREEERDVRLWPGSYSDYAEAQRRERLKQFEVYRDQQERVERIEEDIRRTREHARSVERNVRSGIGADVQRRQAKKVARKAKARERRLARALEEEPVDKPRAGWRLHLTDLVQDAMGGDKLVLEVRDLHAGYGGQQVLRGLDLLVRGQDRVVILGENGSGKSTLLRCLTEAMSYTGTVRLGAEVRPGILSQEADDLPLDRTVLEVFRVRVSMHEDEARTYLHRFLFQGDQVFTRVRDLSYGQRAKLALAVLVVTDANVLLLDEPTSHMDMPALEIIEETLVAYRGPLLLISHDRAFIEQIGINRFLALRAGRLEVVESVEAYEENLQRVRTPRS